MRKRRNKNNYIKVPRIKIEMDHPQRKEIIRILKKQFYNLNFIPQKGQVFFFEPDIEEKDNPALSNSSSPEFPGWINPLRVKQCYYSFNKRGFKELIIWLE